MKIHTLTALKLGLELVWNLQQLAADDDYMIMASILK